jgi:hypothetical protein
VAHHFAGNVKDAFQPTNQVGAIVRYAGRRPRRFNRCRL